VGQEIMAALRNVSKARTAPGAALSFLFSSHSTRGWVIDGASGLVGNAFACRPGGLAALRVCAYPTFQTLNVSDWPLLWGFAHLLQTNHVGRRGRAVAEDLVLE